MTWIDPGKTDPTDTTTFAYRLFQELAPFQPLDTHGHLWALCDGIYAMIQEVEQLTTERADGLPGYANLLDINAVRSDFLGWLGQFVGANLMPGLTDAQQRQYIASLPGFNRCRPATIISAVQATLTGAQYVDLQERAGGAWKYTVVTKPSQTPNPALTRAAIQAQKPGPDQFTHLLTESATYQWAAGQYASYTALKAAYPTYQALANATI